MLCPDHGVPRKNQLEDQLLHVKTRSLYSYTSLGTCVVWEDLLSNCFIYWLMNKETGLAYTMGEGRQS